MKPSAPPPFLFYSSHCRTKIERIVCSWEADDENGHLPHHLVRDDKLNPRIFIVHWLANEAKRWRFLLVHLQVENNGSQLVGVRPTRKRDTAPSNFLPTHTHATTKTPKTKITTDDTVKSRRIQWPHRTQLASTSLHPNLSDWTGQAAGGAGAGRRQDSGRNKKGPNKMDVHIEMFQWPEGGALGCELQPAG